VIYQQNEIPAKGDYPQKFVASKVKIGAK